MNPRTLVLTEAQLKMIIKAIEESKHHSPTFLAFLKKQLEEMKDE